MKTPLLQSQVLDPVNVELNEAGIVLGTAAVGTAIGSSLGGGLGAATGAIIGGLVGALAAGKIKSITLVAEPSGRLVLRYETRF